MNIAYLNLNDSATLNYISLRLLWWDCFTLSQWITRALILLKVLNELPVQINSNALVTLLGLFNYLDSPDLGVRKCIRPVKRLAPIIPMYSNIHFITILESAKRVNT